MLDRLLGSSEQELQAAQVQHDAAGVPFVVQVLVDRPRLLRVLAGEAPMPHLLGDERRLEVGACDRPRVVDAAGELERPLDVLARRLEVRLPAAAARPPREDPSAQDVARKPGALR